MFLGLARRPFELLFRDLIWVKMNVYIYLLTLLALDVPLGTIDVFCETMPLNFAESWENLG